MAAMDIHRRDDLAFPQSLPEFQKLFPDDAACAAYLGRARWPDGFVCPHCGGCGCTEITDPRWAHSVCYEAPSMAEALLLQRVSRAANPSEITATRYAP